ncbi:MAG: hypothetical protein FJ344_05625 [Sphingomonadales bacterium]|nr:hypothetical protein [Sphingomonadales bacterium]
MSNPAGDYSVHHLFDAALQTGWTLVGYRLPDAQTIRWSLPATPTPTLWNKQPSLGFVLAPFSFPTSPAHWIARDFSFTGFDGLSDEWKTLPDPLFSALQSLSRATDGPMEGKSNQTQAEKLKSIEQLNAPEPRAGQPQLDNLHTIETHGHLDNSESGESQAQQDVLLEAEWEGYLGGLRPGASKQGLNGLPDGFPAGSIDVVLNEVSQSEFEERVNAALHEIATGRIGKVVLARSESHPWPKHLHPVNFVRRLCGDYPQAFVNLVLHPDWGLWIGATPELLLEMVPGGGGDSASPEIHPLRRLRSMALAGTLPAYGSSEQWGEKEIREQQVVDDFIAHNWSTRIRNFRRSDRKSLRAGPVQHLCTLLEGESDLPLDELVGQLHPTPAVGGWPKDASLSVMAEIERGSRQLYGGFLGPVESPDEARLFVNLRTLQLRGQYAHLHMGCGILGGSEPHSEWAETVHKSKTLLQHLQSENPKDTLPV